jgi:dipeptidyl aminopeptidase/acylaminoacyl peptidase
MKASPAGTPSTIARGAAREIVLMLAGAAVVRACGLAEWRTFWPCHAPFQTPLDFEDVWIRTADGVGLHAWYMPPADAEPGRRYPAVLHAHGSAGNLTHHAIHSRFLTDHGIGVLLFDYRGFGRSEPARLFRRAALERDTRAALEALMARADVDPDRVGLLGMSVGSCFAMHAAAREPRVRSVVSLSGFASWKSMASVVLPGIGPLLVAPGTDTRQLAAGLGDRELLVLHGQQDEMVPPEHAAEIAQAARDAGVPVELFVHPDGDHANFVRTVPEARQRIARFFERTLAERPRRTEPRVPAGLSRRPASEGSHR